MARKKAVIKISILRKLASMHCTPTEAAAYFKVSPQALNKLLKKSPKAKKAWEEGQENGKLNLRRSQLRLANANATMAIFLGKQYLGQSDKTIQEITGKDGAPLVPPDFSGLSIDEKKQLRELLHKSRPKQSR